MDPSGGAQNCPLGVGFRKSELVTANPLKVGLEGLDVAMRLLKVVFERLDIELQVARSQLQSHIAARQILLCASR